MFISGKIKSKCKELSGVRVFSFFLSTACGGLIISEVSCMCMLIARKIPCPSLPVIV